jgi:hypothetical protein
MSKRTGNRSDAGIGGVSASAPNVRRATVAACLGWAAGCLALAVLGGCTPADVMMQRLGTLDDELRPVVRDSIWGHGNPYVWGARRNLVIETRWTDYFRGLTPVESRRTYCIDLTSRRMRIDDLTTQTTSMFDGTTWRVYFRGKPITKPTEVTPETVGQLFMFEQAADEMRLVREFFCMPFSLLADGVKLSSSGQVRSAAGASLWNVARVDFNPAVTGHWHEDHLFVYFDPITDRVDRAMIVVFNTIFNGIPHWGEWSDYRRVGERLIMPHVLDFRMTDAAGTADLGRQLTIQAERMAFDVDLPSDIYATLLARPPRLPGEPATTPRQLGRDDVHGRTP